MATQAELLRMAAVVVYDDVRRVLSPSVQQVNGALAAFRLQHEKKAKYNTVRTQKIENTRQELGMLLRRLEARGGDVTEALVDLQIGAQYAPVWFAQKSQFMSVNLRPEFIYDMCRFPTNLTVLRSDASTEWYSFPLLPPGKNRPRNASCSGVTKR